MTDEFEELPKMAGWHESSLIVPTSSFAISAAKPNHNICLFNSEGEVCKLDFNGPELKFTGNPDDGAKVFLDFVSKYFDQRLKDEYSRGYNDAKQNKEPQR